jgi:phage-related minor tail protein
MTDTRKAQLEIGVNAGPAEEGFKRVERAAKGMSDQVKKSGDEASKGMDGIGKGADEGAKKLDKATSSIIASVQRTTAAMQAGEKGTAKYFETLANQRGVDAAVLQPYLDGLRAVEKAQGQVGMSARATAAAMRTVPAQFTDIVTSLQGGQAPLTVLLQQGGQLKDQFGGIGNAARSLGGYVLGLVNPFTVAAAAVGTLGVAYYQGSKEADEFRKALVLSGNAAGASVGQLASLAESIGSGFGKNVGQAAEALTVLAASGGVGRASLKEFATTAIDAEKALGIATKDIAKNFADLAKDPLGASVKLNESMNYLTLSTYAQIKAAQDLGQESKAAALAQDAYNNALQGRSDEVLQNAGRIEKAWSGIKSAASAAWDAMLGTGRTITTGAQLETAQRVLKDTLSRQKQFGEGSFLSGLLDGEVSKLREKIANLTEIERLNKRAGDNAAEQARQVKARIEADKEGLKYAGDDVRMQKEIAQQVANLRTAKASELEIETRIAQIRASYAKKTPAATGGQSELAGLRARTIEAERYLAALKELGLEADKLTEGERAALRLREELKGTLTAQVRASKEASLAEAERLGTVQRLIVAEKDQAEQAKKTKAETAKFFEDSIKAQAAAVNTAEKGIEAIKKQTAAEREAMASIGLTKEAIAELTTVKIDDNAATLDRLASIMAEAGEPELLIKKYREEAQALRDLAKAKRERGAAETAQAVTKDDADKRKKDAEEATKAAQKALSEFDNLIGAIDLSKLNGMFNGAVDGALKFATALNTVASVAEKTEAALAANAKINAGDGAKRASEEARILAQSATAQISAYGSMAAGLKSYAKEGTKAYEALSAAEKVFRAFELASAISNAATKSGLLAAFVGTKVAGDAAMSASAATNAGAEIAATTAIAGAKAVSGVVNQSGGDPYTAFPRMAAMAAIMAALGFATGAIGGGSGGGAAPTNSGTGTVFGDKDARSESFSKSMDLLNDIQDEALIYSKAMAASLRSIEANIGGFTNIFLRTGGTSGLTGGIATGTFDTGLSKTLNFGKELLGPLGGIFSNLTTKLFGKKVSITGSGISANDQTLGDILSGGFEGNTFADVQTRKKAFGFTYSNKNSTALAELDPALARQITGIFSGVGTAIGVAADLLGQDTLSTQKKLQDYVVSIGRVDLQGLKGEEIAEKLGAVFGAESDKIAASVIPGFEALQKVGEGYFETLTRVASQFELVNVYMGRLGDTLGAVGIAGATASDDLVQIFGGLDAFQSAISDYYDNFYSEAERNAQATKELGTAFAGLGQTLPSTIEGYRDLVKAQDLTTEAGRETYASLIALSPAFKKVADAAAEAAKKIEDERIGLELQILQAQGNTAALRTRERNAIDASNRALYDQLKALEDAKAAQEAYNQALSSAQSALASALSRVQSAQSGVDAVREQGTSAYLAALTEVASIQEQIAAETRQTASAYRDLAQQLREYVSGIVVPPSASFAQALTKALAGDREAMASLPGLATSASEQARNQAANREEFAIAQARILSGVLEASAEAQRRGIETPAQAAQTLQQKLVESQGKLAEALSAANAIGAPLAARQDRLIDQYTKALSELATANSEAALARAQLALLVGNTAATATNTGNTAANTATTGALTQEIKALGTIINVGGLVKFDPADPIRSVFDNISKTNTVLNAQFVKWIEITSGSLVTQNTEAGTISVSAITGFMTDTNRAGGAAGFPGQYVLAYDSTNYLMQIASNTATTSAILNNLAFGQYSMLVRGFGPGQSVPVSFRRDGQSTDYFATGAAFSNGIVTRPTSFNMGMMGEAGPEAIMPLTNVNGTLGIRGQMPGAEGMLQALQTMQMLMQRLQTVGETTALTSQDLLSLLKRLTRDGRAMPVAPSVNDPLTVKVIA